ncbi:hypothetical protein CLHUN_31720 [Ruminiclostridium hungatei]|uniref:Prepilin-type N-terminal cleavage/methylation domain-containing protein n=1 Tax=Ruminiclostridium hungatei TaxID=48256 RepID=A0A1V4SGM7_RUMHU|nr:prepilin-type N-terminal cleavage/methylation domain-containing protein [Ruminiclostridium hungatei]OPX43028.1 hypothetical protein CLHUN_31720 [Ruminiclostridium hungatei]
MKTSNNKGFALVEMIIVIALIAIVLPLILQLYMFGQETFSYNTRLVAQQYTVTNVLSHVRGDVQEAASVDTSSVTSGDQKTVTLKLGYYDGGTPAAITKVRYWRIRGTVGGEGILEYSGEKNIADILTDSDYAEVVTGLDMDKCNFERRGFSNPERHRLSIQVKPLETNTGKGAAKNMREAIMTEISVLYKETLDS